MINKFEKDGLYFIALGGADEIGMNMYVFFDDESKREE